jgi:hypothetical protein
MNQYQLGIAIDEFFYHHPLVNIALSLGVVIFGLWFLYRLAVAIGGGRRR